MRSREDGCAYKHTRCLNGYVCGSVWEVPSVPLLCALQSVNMLHQLNKPIPSQIATQITTEQADDGSIQERKEKAELQQGSKIKFIGGQHLSSTGEYVSNSGEDESKNVYPPGAELPKVAKGEGHEVDLFRGVSVRT